MPPRLAKLLAAIAALAMVGGALWFRSRDGGDDGGLRDDGAPGDPIRVVCVTELEAACRQLAPDGIEVVAVEDAGATADRLGRESGDDLDAWVTIDPWPEMVDVVRGQQQQDPLFGEPIRVASSDLVLVLAGDELPAECGWDSAVDGAGEQRRIGVPPLDDAIGPQVVGSTFASHYGDVTFSRADYSDPWLAELTSFPPAADAVDQMATRGAAAFIAAGTSEQQALDRVESRQGQSRGLRFGQPEVAARADVVVAPVQGRDVADRLEGIFTGENALEHFVDDGWTAPAAEGATGLPAADLLVALREEIGA